MQTFKIILPSPLLTKYIRHYWILKDDSRVTVNERTLPTGCVNMIFHRGKPLMTNGRGLQPQAFISGQSMKFEDVHSTGKIDMISVVVEPCAARLFLHIPANLFYGQSVSTEETSDNGLKDISARIRGLNDDNLCIDIIEQFLIKRLYALPEHNIKRITAVLNKINTDPRINMNILADTACLGEKQLNRIFTEYVGASPKDFMRIIRIQRALHTMQKYPAVTFAQLAYECGFYDQSHMIKEFRQFSGYTPAEYISVCMPYSDYFSQDE